MFLFQNIDFSSLDPNRVRNSIIGSLRYKDNNLPRTGSNFFIHLTELCPVACSHCMYSSTLTRKSARDSFDKRELEDVIDFINQSKSTKLTISGGGEPFLKFGSILRLIEATNVPRIEIVTAGHWGRSQERAMTVLAALTDASDRNPRRPVVDLRLSIDRYHIEAPHPVPLTNYRNVALAWMARRDPINLGYRGLLVDWDDIDVALASSVGIPLYTVNDWNRELIVADGRKIPITYNVFRFSGGAESWDRGKIKSDRSAREYFRSFETSPGKLVLATAVNDAIRGKYDVEDGVAITLHSDGTFWIFCGTAPDRKLQFSGQRFGEAVAYFYEDPITRFLASEGVWRLTELVKDINPQIAEAAIAKNDITSIVDDILADPLVRLRTTMLIANQMIADGSAILDGSLGSGSGYRPEQAVAAFDLQENVK